MEKLDGARIRRERLKAIINMLLETKGLEKRSLIGWIIMNTGLTEKTAEKYVEELFKFGLIYKKGSKFYARQTK